MKILILLVLLKISYLTSVPPETYLNITDYCKYYNYPIEEHQIITKDNYVLTYFRIQAKGSLIQKNLRVVYFQHGFIDSSDTFIVNREEMAPAFVIANEGFDVWLGNSRGNKHSHQHLTLSTDSEEFWDFSWPEMAEYDLPAAFSYISNTTNQIKIDYVGHSLGSMIMFAALAQQNIVIQEHLGKFISIGPAVFIKNQKSQLMKTIGNMYVWENTLMNLGVYEIFTSNNMQSHATAIACQFLPILCKWQLRAISDLKPELDNEDRMPVVMGHYPSGCSLYTSAHLAQMQKYKNYQIQKFDYLKKDLNMKHYGQSEPPVYNISQVKADIFLMAGVYDMLADVEDVEQLRNQLLPQNPNLFYKTYEAGHATFIWGQNQEILQDMIKILG